MEVGDLQHYTSEKAQRDVVRFSERLPLLARTRKGHFIFGLMALC